MRVALDGINPSAYFTLWHFITRERARAWQRKKSFTSQPAAPGGEGASGGVGRDARRLLSRPRRTARRVSAHSSRVTRTNEAALDKMDRSQCWAVGGGVGLDSFSIWHVAPSHISQSSEWWRCGRPSKKKKVEESPHAPAPKNCTAGWKLYFNSSIPLGWSKGVGTVINLCLF